MSLEVNVDPRWAEGSPEMFEARRHGVRWVRLISLPECESYAADCLATGVRTLGIYTGESDAANHYVLRACSALQIGNEPQFAMDGAASWPTGTADDFVNVWSHVAGKLVPEVHPGGLPLVGPGIWSQDYAKWALIAHRLPGLSAAGVHVYPGPSGHSITQVKSFLSKYRAVRPDLPLICTEWLARGADTLPTARALDTYCDLRLWYAWAAGEPGHALNGTPELGVLAMTRSA